MNLLQMTLYTTFYEIVNTQAKISGEDGRTKE